VTAAVSLALGVFVLVVATVVLITSKNPDVFAWALPLIAWFIVGVAVVLMRRAIKSPVRHSRVRDAVADHPNSGDS
jgi:hypothetical protein